METLPNGWILAAAQPTRDRCEAHGRGRCKRRVRYYLRREGTRDAGYCTEHADVIRTTVAVTAKVDECLEAIGAFYVVRDEDGGSPSRSAPWRPLSGPFATREAAESDLGRVERLYGPGRFAVVMRNAQDGAL